MPISIQQNLNNKEVLVQANELIEFFKKSDNPWTGNFFPFEVVKNTAIKFVVKKPISLVTKITDKSTSVDADYIDTEPVSRLIQSFYVSGQKILEVDLLADNGQDLKDTAQYEVANNLNNQIAKDDIQLIGTVSKIVEIDNNNELDILKAMLKAWDNLFQAKNSANCKFFLTNDTYDLLVYLANNKVLIGDNTVAQLIRLDGKQLFVKGAECQIVVDDYMTFINSDKSEKIPFILATPRAIKRYFLENMNVYISPNSETMPRKVLIGGEVLSDAFAYMLNSEKDSRWMYRGKFKEAPVIIDASTTKNKNQKDKISELQSQA